MSGIKGARELEYVLRQLPRKVGVDVLSRALRAGANIVRDEAKRTAPMPDAVSLNDKRYIFRKKKYGHLRDNIKVTATRHKGGAAQMTVHTGRAFWGMWLEFGTSKMAARPWFTAAFERTHQQALDVAGERLGKNIEQAARLLSSKSYGKLSRAMRRRLSS